MDNEEERVKGLRNLFDELATQVQQVAEKHGVSITIGPISRVEIILGQEPAAEGPKGTSRKRPARRR